MNRKTLIVYLSIGIVVLCCATMLVRGQAKGANQKSEAAMLKWDGNDKVQVMTPAKSEVIRVYQSGGQRVQDIPDEEYCLTWVANKLAQEGWELVNLNNRRVLMQRPIAR